MASSRMDILNMWLPLIGGGLFGAIAIGAWFGDQRMVAIWFGFAGAVCLLLLAALQLQEHERTIKISDSGPKIDESNRPWINVEPQVGSDLTYDAQGDARIVINFFLQNVGKFPAANVHVDAEFVLIFGDSRPAQQAIADRNKARPAGLGSFGVTIFPGPPSVHSINLGISRKDIEAHHTDMLGRLGNPKDGIPYQFLPALVGVVDYKFTFAEGYHQTGFIPGFEKN